MPAPKTVPSEDLLRRMDAYWRAANYLSVGQIYLRDNPLLRKPLTLEHVKAMLLGHWGTTPGQNFIYVHLNRIIQQYDLNMIYLSGPGHGGPAVVGNTYLEGTYSEVYPQISRDEEGLKRLFTQFSFPGGIPSHVSPECPGSIHEGGELGYSLSHAFGAVFDNPDLIAACVVGDGEAETGPLATAWHSNKFLNPITDGVVLPILHLNGYKIANPTIFARISHEEQEQFFRGCGWNPLFVRGSDPQLMHVAMAAALDEAIEQIRTIRLVARTEGLATRPRWPVIILESPKGWTGPKFVDGVANENTFRSHQVPLSVSAHEMGHLEQLEEWLRSYRPDELFDARGRLRPDLAVLAPTGERRMGANPHANGGALLHELRMPDFCDYALDVPHPGITGPGDTRVFAQFLRKVTALNTPARNFRIFGPDETISNGLEAVFEATERQWNADTRADDQYLAHDGRVMEVLSEHQCQGWLEGYLLTGRHGLFNCYEAFVHIVDSMFNQHAKWLKVTAGIPWRREIASLNYLLASHVWRQDHNGFTHQDPGFIDHVVNKKAGVVRVYLPPDANCLLSVMDHCLRSKHYVNVVVAGKHPSPQWLNMDAALVHCSKGIDIWSWASNDQLGEPDVVMACAGDVPTLETLAAVSVLRQHLPTLRIRVINVVDLMKLQPHSEHPHGLDDLQFDELFTRDKPVIFAFHAYPWLIHRLTYRRTNHANFHVRGYKEEGTITTAFDMTVLNELDRFHLAMDVIDRVPGTGTPGLYLKQQLQNKLIEHKRYIAAHGVDMPEVRDWAVAETVMEMHRILVATDFSAAGHAAVARAGQLAVQYRCPLTVFHATPDWTLFSQRASAHQAHYADITRNADELMRGEVNWLLQECGLTAVRGEIHRDRAALAITRAIESFQPNVVVIGAGGEHLLLDGQIVLGGTALKLISRVSVPLLMVRNTSPVPYTVTLAAVGAEASTARRLAHWASALAGTGTYHLVRAYEAPYANRMRLCRYADAEIAQSADEQRHIARQDCEALEPTVPGGAHRVIHIVRGAPVSAVLEQVRECAPQLVVVGQHQHHANEHPGAWAAGLGTRIAYHCPTDVLIVP